MVPILYGLALLAGLFASAIAVLSLLIRGDYVGVSDKDVFNLDVLKDSERLDFASLPESARNPKETEQQDNHTVAADLSGSTPPQTPSTEPTVSVEQPATASASEEAEVQSNGEPAPPYPKSATAYYRRFMTVHIWLIARKHFDIHEIKAKRIRLGQTLFFVFLLFIAAIGVSLTAVALIQQSRLADKAQSKASSESTTQQPMDSQHPRSNAGTPVITPPTKEPAQDTSDSGTISDVGDGGTTLKQ
jgi:hypothetical protein